MAYTPFKMKGPSLYTSPLKSACTPEGCPASGGGVTDSSKDPSKKTGGGEQKIKKQESVKRPESKEQTKGTEGQEAQGEEKAKKEKSPEEKAAEKARRSSSISQAGAMLAS